MPIMVAKGPSPREMPASITRRFDPPKRRSTTERSFHTRRPAARGSTMVPITSPPPETEIPHPPTMADARAPADR
jgi:hypothetical protein